ncbi:MAG: efflux transporter periplasmic adaptor subunit, partial [Variovorax sp.]
MQSKLSNLSRRAFWPAVTGLTAVLAIASAVFGLSSFNAEANDAPAVTAPRATPVSVATVAATQVNTWDEFSGRLEAVERVDVRSRVAGAVAAVHFREGALV